MVVMNGVLRGVFSGLSAFGFTLVVMPFWIKQQKKWALAQPIRALGPATHQKKSGTPTMGGVVLLLAVLVSGLIWGQYQYALWLPVCAMLGFGVLGLVDDGRKLWAQDSQGLSAPCKYLWQSILAVVVVATPQSHWIYVPLWAHHRLELGWCYPVLGYFVVVGTSNAVNLTDGLDGLAAIPIALVGMALGLVAYWLCWAGCSPLGLYLPHAGEALIVSAGIVGAALGFLWFNSHPAQIFMGDVGALGLGAALGTVSLVLKQELLLFLVGGVFIAETVSVCLQVGRFKLSGKRVFLMAPLHHHFELKGWSESQIVHRFSVVTVLLVVLALVLLCH